MAIAIGNSIGTIADLSSITGTITFTANANRVLLIGAGGHQDNITAITLNGTALTRNVLGTTQFNEQFGMWLYNNPPSGGQGTIVASSDGGNGNGFVAAEFNGVKQTGQPAATGHGDLGNSNSALGTVTSLTNNNYLVGGFYSEANWSSDGGGQTNIANKQAQSFENLAMSYIPQTTAGAGTMSWNLGFGARWATAIVALEPAGAASAYNAGLMGLLGVGF